MSFFDAFSKFSKFQKGVFIFSIVLGLSSFLITLVDAVNLASQEDSIGAGVITFLTVLGSNMFASDVKIDMAITRLQDPLIDQFYASYLRETILKSFAVIFGMGYLFYMINKFIFGNIFNNIDKDKSNFGFTLLLIVISIAMLMVIEIMIKIFVYDITSFPELLPFHGVGKLITNFGSFLNSGLPSTIYQPIPDQILNEQIISNLSNGTV